MDKGKGGLSLLVKMGKKPPTKDDSFGGGDKPMEMDDAAPADMDSKPDMGMSGDDGSSGDSKVDMALDDVADAAGVPEENRDAFRSALRNAIKACMDSDAY